MVNNIRISPIGAVVITATCLAVLYFTVGIPKTISSHFVNEKINLRRLLAVSITLARKGGAIVKAVRQSEDTHQTSKGKTAEGVDDVLTAGDIKSHLAITQGFKGVFPNLKVISEEQNHVLVGGTAPVLNTKNAMQEVNEEGGDLLFEKSVAIEDVVVWVDPLDATKEYAEKTDKDGKDLLKYVTTMVCVAIKGKPVIGVIHRPFSGETEWAWVGYGSNVHPKLKPIESEVRMIVSRTHAGNVRKMMEAAFPGKKVRIVGAGGAGYKSSAVLHGEADMYAHLTAIKKWDICAGHALLLANGGNMTSLSGDVIDYSPGAAVKLQDGLLATMKGHKGYLEKVTNFRQYQRT